MNYTMGVAHDTSGDRGHWCASSGNPYLLLILGVQIGLPTGYSSSSRIPAVYLQQVEVQGL
jgi:hypothetical protein